MIPDKIHERLMDFHNTRHYLPAGGIFTKVLSDGLAPGIRGCFL